MKTPLSLRIAQINPVAGDIEGNTQMIVDLWENYRDDHSDIVTECDLILLPEMAISGYPLEDLVLKPSFLRDVKSGLEVILEQSKHHKAAMLVTLPWLEEAADGTHVVYNSLCLVQNGESLALQHKHKLPNYGVFDEARVFSPGPLPQPVDFMGYKLGLLICEDMWSPDVAGHLAEQGADLLIVSNGSPYDCRKVDRRFSLARDRVAETGLPLIYVNLYGGQDELVFDGGSFVLDRGQHKIFQAPYFCRAVGSLRFPFQENKVPDDLTPNPEMMSYQACMLGLRDYMAKNGAQHVLIGMSGGIDSALSAAIAVDALGADHVHCVMMASPFTSQESLDAAQDCAQRLGASYRVIDIEPAMQSFTEMIADECLISGETLAYENMQARIRGTILMTLSNMMGALVLSTGNKSENAVGYATLYGDMCGAFSVLKDMFKSQVYALARWRNQLCPPDAAISGVDVIPEIIITRPPTAELRENQKDEDSLPPYEVLDSILESIVEKDMSLTDIVAQGHHRELVLEIWDKVDACEYKRRQGPPGVKLTTRSFGRERRYPMTNRYRPKKG